MPGNLWACSNHHVILIYSPPQVMLLAINLHEYFIDEKGVAVTPVSTLQAPGKCASKLDAPEADGFITDCDASFGEDIFNIPLAELESIVEPDCAGNAIWRKSVALVCIHAPILAISAS